MPRDDRNHPVEHPDHYTHGKIECIDVIEDWQLPFHAAQVLKYLCRYRWKGSPLLDLQKARWYLDRMISKAEKEG
jgi:hypothetical protein